MSRITPVRSNKPRRLGAASHQVHAAHVTDDREAQALAAAVEWLTQLESIDDLNDAARMGGNAIQRQVLAKRVLVGWQPPGRSECRLVYDSMQESTDVPEATRRKAEYALDECVIRGSSITIQAEGKHTTAHATLAITHFAKHVQSRNLFACPLVDGAGKVRGAWIFLDFPNEDRIDADANVVKAFSRPFCARLQSIERNQPSPVSRAYSKFHYLYQRYQSKTVGGFLAAMVLACFIPVTYRIRTDCVLEPVQRRYVAAPFDGPLQKAFVRPGDKVQQGTLLAEMDARELDWELAGLQADHSKAEKERQISLAGGDLATSQIADLETQRIEHRQALLQDRVSHLQIRSPIAGIVVAGDNQEAEGAPLETGQTLFEIAPLGQMTVELHVAESDYMYVQHQMTVEVTLDAFPRTPLEGRIERVRPKAEIQDNENVFVAELLVDDPQQIYRPGMRGRAAIDSVRRPFVWILLHKPWNALMMWLGW